MITLANVDRFSKVFHQLIREKILYAQTHKDFCLTCDMLLHYLVIVENAKMLLILTASSTNCCSVPKNTLNIWFNHLTVVRQTVSRLLTLTDWLLFWSLWGDVSNQKLNVIELNVVSLHHCDFFFTMIIFTPSSFFLRYTSCVLGLQIFK